MSYESKRIMSAVIFALIWTAGMLWWFHPTPVVMPPALLAIAGVLIGLLRYWVHGRLWRNIE
jgi:hypothetical protein